MFIFLNTRTSSRSCSNMGQKDPLLQRRIKGCLGQSISYNLLFLVVTIIRINHISPVAAAAAKSGLQVIPLQRRPLFRPPAAATFYPLGPSSSAAAAPSKSASSSSSSTNNSSTTQLYSYVKDMYAYFAQLTFAGEQTIDVLLDTGSTNLLVPSTLCTSETCSDDHVPQKLDTAAAQAGFVACDDPVCKVHFHPSLSLISIPKKI